MKPSKIHHWGRVLQIPKQTLHLNEASHGVMVIVAGYGQGDTSSNPGPGWLHFT